ncbi:MAG: Npt1/Npt2 family nucleotide transporter [Dokdonia sp.]|jgi:AAA family ATP:ADP antiporter
MVQKMIKKTFGLRDGELSISFLMQLFIFLIITVLLMVKPTVNALFLSALGADHLPYAYLLVACTAVISAYFYNKAVRKISLVRLINATLVICSGLFFVLSVLLHRGQVPPWALYFYYLAVALFAVVTTSQFWILANMVYNSREAKRLFGFIGAGAIAGGIFGGYLTSLIAAAFGNKVVIAIAAILLLICIPILLKIWQLRIRIMNAYVRKQKRMNEVTQEQPSWKIISKSKHLTYLAIIMGVSVVVAKLVDFQFSDFAHRVIANPEDLASFFGFWFSTFNVIALLLQLFLTNRVLSKIGVSSTLLILPLGIAIGSLVFLTFPLLGVLIAIKGIDGSFKQSVNKAAFELSIMPIPLNIKNQAKSFIDVVVDSVATGLSGFLLLFVIRKLDLSTAYVTVIVIFFVFVWILFIYKLREAYYESFRANIQDSILKRDDVLNESGKSETTITAARRILRGSDTQAIINLLDRLESYKIKALKSSIVNLFDHPASEIKVAALGALVAYPQALSLETVKLLIHEKNDDLVVAAMEFLLHHHDINTTDFFEAYLDHHSPFIAHAALLCLSKESVQNQKLAIQFKLEERLQKRMESIENTDYELRDTQFAELLITIGYARISSFYPIIETYLNSDNVYLRKHAIKAAGISMHPPFIAVLLQQLAFKTFRPKAIKALRNYGPGITTTIIKLDKSEDFNDKIKRYIPQVVESFKSQEAVRVLMRLLKSNDFVIRQQASTSLLHLYTHFGNLRFTTKRLKAVVINESRHVKNAFVVKHYLEGMNAKVSKHTQIANTATQSEEHMARNEIVEILGEQIETSLETMFNLLGILYNADDMRITYAGLRSDQKETRINALEFLDTFLKGPLKYRLIPIFDFYIANDPNLKLLQNKALTEKGYLSLLLRSRGKRLKLKVLELIGVFEDPSYRSLVKSLQNHRNSAVRAQVKNTLAMLSK